MRNLHIDSRLKSLLQRTNIGQLNAVYSGIGIGIINSNPQLASLMVENNKKEIESIILDAFYDINECCVIDRDIFINIVNKLITIKFTVFKVPKFYFSSKTSKFKDLLQLKENLGGIEGDIEDNMDLFKSAIGVTMYFYEEKQVNKEKLLKDSTNEETENNS